MRAWLDTSHCAANSNTAEKFSCKNKSAMKNATDNEINGARSDYRFD